MITLHDYWMGRDDTHPLEMSPHIQHNAAVLLDAVNALLVVANLNGVRAGINPDTGTVVSTGWRPPRLNAVTPRAAKNSKHMTGQAVDVYDPAGVLDQWIFTHENVPKGLDLWMEHPGATPTWCHMQSVPPANGARFFWP